MRRLPILAAGVLALAAAAAPAGAATVLNATWTDACSKATCFNEDGVYRQTFKASDFTGPVTIGKLLMDRGVLGSLDGATFRISFAQSGQELGTWGNYNMGGIGGDQLSFSGFEFTWNPDDGDLELVLAITPPPKPGAGGVLLSVPAAPTTDTGGQGAGLGDPTPQFLTPGGGPVGGDGEGGGLDALVTAVPEPAAWAMMITGFGLAGAVLRRRRAILA